MSWPGLYTLAHSLREKLSGIDGITVTDQGSEQCGLVTFTATQMDAVGLKTALSGKQITVSVSTGSGSFVTFRQRNLTAVVRASIHYYNTEEEIDRFILILAKLLKKV